MNIQIRINNNQLPQMKNMGYGKPGPKWIHPDRVLDYHDFLFIVNGTFQVFEEETEYILEKGDILFLKAGLHHFGQRKNSEDVEWYYIHFYLKDELPPEQTLEDSHFATNSISFDNTTKIILPKTLKVPETMQNNFITQLEILLKNYWYQENLISFSLNIKLMELLLDITRIEIQTLDRYKPSYFVLKMKKYLESISDKPYHSTEITEELKMNYNYLRLFSKII